jgi:tetratricopeptide (TPR) repeat protein
VALLEGKMNSETLVLNEQKQYQAAETAYREAIAFTQRAETPDGWVQAKNASYNLADQFGNSSDFKKAKEYYQQSVRYYFQSGKFVNSIETSFYRGVDCFLKIVPLEADIDKLESKSVNRPLGIVGYTGQYGVNTWGDKLEDDKKQTVMQQLSVVLNAEVTHATN